MPQNAKTSLLLRLLITADGPLLPFLTLQPGKAVIYLRRNAKDRVDDEVTGSWSFSLWVRGKCPPHSYHES